MKNKPLVSIIMNCHNGEKFLKESIQSIISQKYKKWELIFWDNKSTDESAKILKSFKDKRIRYFKSKKKTVLYQARNFALKKTKGKFIAFLDTDDIWCKDKLSLQIPKFKNNSIGLVYSNFFKLNYNGKKKLAFKNKLPSGRVTSLIIKNYQVGILTVILRKKFLKNKKLFDFKFDLIADFEFILNFSKKYNFASIEKPLACYRIHENQLQKVKMISQAKQFCLWFKQKNIEEKFKNYDLTQIKKKYEYYDIIRNIERSKIKTLMKLYYKFSIKNFLKVISFLIIPKKILFRFMEYV
jgi:glycosyltransferase involved in cell wall biosynthesis